MSILKLLSVAALGLLCANCATVTRGTTSQVQIFSEPSGADVATSTGFRCTTPCTLTIDRKQEFTVSMSKPGYKPVEVPVRTQVAGTGAAGFAGNIIAGGLVGMAADAATGATLEHVPNPVSATLQPVDSPSRPQNRRKPQPSVAAPAERQLPPIPAAPAPLQAKLPETS